MLFFIKLFQKYDKYRLLIFTVGLILYVSSLLLRSTTYLYTSIPFILDLLFSLMSYVAYFIMLIIIFLDNIKSLRYLLSRFQFYIFLLFSILLLYITLKTDTKSVLYAYLTVLASKNIRFQYILKISFYTSMITTLSIVILSVIGFLPDWIFYRGDAIRHSFGFYYTTTLSHIFFFDVLVFFAIRKKLTMVDTSAILFINFLVYYFTKSRNSFLLIIFFLISYFLLCKFKNYIKKILIHFKTITNFFIDHIYTIFLLLSILVAYLYNGQSVIWQSLNSLLNNRIMLMANAIHHYGLTFFGQYIEWVGTTDVEKFGSYLQYNYVDNAFLQLLLVQGIFMTFFLYFMIYKLMKSLRMKKQYYYILCMIFVAIHSLLDPQLLYLEMNSFLFLLSPIIYQQIYGKNI